MGMPSVSLNILCRPCGSHSACCSSQSSTLALTQAKLQKRQKHQQCIEYASGAQADLSELKLSDDTFGTKFDVVLIDPPWAEYVRRAPGAGPDVSWNWQQIKALEVEAITAVPSFVFLW